MATLALLPIAGGTLGSFQTLAHMRALVRQALADPLVIETAREIVQALPARDADAHALAIREYLSEHLQFIPDPRGQETTATPRYLLTAIGRHYVVQGDCDDAAVLGAALTKAIGLRARFVVLGFFRPNAPFTHVFTAVRGRTRWWDLDTTRAARRLVQAPVTRVHHVEV